MYMYAENKHEASWAKCCWRANKKYSCLQWDVDFFLSGQIFVMMDRTVDLFFFFEEKSEKFPKKSKLTQENRVKRIALWFGVASYIWLLL